MKRIVRSIALVGLLAGCTIGPGAEQPDVAPGPSETPVPLATVGWGPLAVGAWGTGAEARVEGTLRITETCVFLEAVGQGDAIVVWRPDHTRWLGESRQIEYRNQDGSTVLLSDGDAVTFGGGGDSTAESGIGGPAWIASTTWVVPPDPSCPIETRWFINESLGLADSARLPATADLRSLITGRLSSALHAGSRDRRAGWPHRRARRPVHHRCVRA